MALDRKEAQMKLVIAIIQPHKLEDVLEELDKAQIYLKTVSHVLGCGRQKGRTEVYRGKKETGNLLKKVRIEVSVNDAYLPATIIALKTGARTGAIGDGKIFVLDLEECYRIRTGEKGSDAIG
jgi:nitrogen regulatory protein P-II 1